MKYRFLFYLVLMVFLSSCVAGKVHIGSTIADANLSLKNCIATHQATAPNFETLAARVQVLYENDEKTQSITVSLRMEKDKTIWLKASILGITLAKVLITPNKVSYYETINKTYFDGDFTLISQWLGTSLDFEQVQNILLGQSIFQLDSKLYEKSIFQNKYKIEPINQPANFMHTLLLHPENFKVASENITQAQEERFLTINYSNYKKIEGSFYPFNILINTTDHNKETRIKLSFKKIDHNALIRFPFTIPEGYKKIEIN